MSLLTTNYNLVKPELTDPADITATNGNWDKVDGELKKLNTASSETNTKVSNLTTTVSNQKTELTNKINTEVGKLQPKITYGTSKPSGGNSGDVYIQIIED